MSLVLLSERPWSRHAIVMLVLRGNRVSIPLGVSMGPRHHADKADSETADLAFRNTLTRETRDNSYMTDLIKPNGIAGRKQQHSTGERRPDHVSRILNMKQK